MGGPEFSIPRNILKLHMLRGGESPHRLPSPCAGIQDSAPGGPTEPSRGQQRCQGKLTSENPAWVCSSPPPGCPRLSRPQRTQGLPGEAEQCHPLPVDSRKQASLLGSLQNRDCGALKEKKGATRGLSPTPTTIPPRAAEELCPPYHARALPKCPALRVVV